jgi:hypothetical protein
LLSYSEPFAAEPSCPLHSEDVDLVPEPAGTVVLPCHISSSGDTALLNIKFSVHNCHIHDNVSFFKGLLINMTAVKIYSVKIMHHTLQNTTLRKIY